jgi:antitoxin Phd
MKQVTATEAKNNFGQMLEMTRSEPIAIEKNGRRVAVMLSFSEYQRLVELEDRYWGEKAVKALEGGFVGEESGNQWLKEKLNAEAADK